MKKTFFLFVTLLITASHANAQNLPNFSRPSVSCTVSGKSVNIGEVVTYNVNVMGGVGIFKYSWIDGESNKTFNTNLTERIVKYQKTGLKKVLVKVSSGKNSITAKCPDVFVTQKIEPLKANCEVDKKSIFLGQNVSYSAIISGGTSSYNFLWNGPVQRVNAPGIIVEHDKVGLIQNVSVNVTSGRQNVTAKCPSVDVKPKPKPIHAACVVDKKTVTVTDSVVYNVSKLSDIKNYIFDWKGAFENLGANVDYFKSADKNTPKIKVNYSKSGIKNGISVSVKSSDKFKLTKKTGNFETLNGACQTDYGIGWELANIDDVDENYLWTGNSGLPLFNNYIIKNTPSNGAPFIGQIDPVERDFKGDWPEKNKMVLVRNKLYSDMPKTNSQYKGLCKNMISQNLNLLCPAVEVKSKNESLPIPNNLDPVNQQPPAGCTSWFDGCNTCSVTNGKIGACTKRACSVYEPSQCTGFDAVKQNGFKTVSY